LIIRQSASYELRKLFYDVLVADDTLTSRVYYDEQGNVTAAKVYDTVPPKVKKPYVTVGKAAIKIDRDTQSKDMFADIYMVEIDCFTHYGGKADVSQLMNDAMYALSAAAVNQTLQFDDGSAFRLGIFEIDVRGEDVSVWGPKEAEHSVLTCNVRVVQVK
jgi:hypothetical protein